MPKKTQYKHKLEYNNTYNRNNYRSFSVRFNVKNEDSVIEWLEQKEGVKAYLTDLILADMEKNGLNVAAIKKDKPAAKEEAPQTDDTKTVKKTSRKK